jgi:DNA-directed RNA polymerase subunit RPC12/RpoP
LYEELEMWDEAGRVRRKEKANTVKHVHVDANKLFNMMRNEGLAVSYRCPNCKGDLKIDGSNRTKFCTYCGSEVNIDKLSKMVDKMLE